MRTSCLKEAATRGFGTSDCDAALGGTGGRVFTITFQTIR